MGDVLTRQTRLTLEQFRAFLDERPEREKWELIDGVPMMMAPPTLLHQRISKNLETMLDNRLRVVRPEWMADREIGILLPHDETFSPKPDVTVIETAIEIGQTCATRFYFVAEVLSECNRPESHAGSDNPTPLAAKIAYYQRHAPCAGILIVRQDRIAATLYRRDAGFRATELKNPADRLDIPSIGDIGSLADLYRSTPLWPGTAPA